MLTYQSRRDKPFPWPWCANGVYMEIYEGQWQEESRRLETHGLFAAVGHLLSLRYLPSPPEILVVKAPNVPIFGLVAGAVPLVAGRAHPAQILREENRFRWNGMVSQSSRDMHG